MLAQEEKGLIVQMGRGDRHADVVHAMPALSSVTFTSRNQESCPVFILPTHILPGLLGLRPSSMSYLRSSYPDTCLDCSKEHLRVLSPGFVLL